MSRRALPVAADIFARHIAIPMHANLTEDDVTYVSETLRTIVFDGAVRR